ncbi:hypothetical protein BsWGS_13685 [Bradybaena similaris]
MGSLCAKSEPPPSDFDPTPDPITALTEKDRYLIVQSWKTIGAKKDIKENGKEFFLMLFTDYPYTQNYFGIFKNKQLSELRESPKMKVHAAAVFYFIATYIEHIEDPETLLGLMEKMVSAHISRGITVEEFEKIRLEWKKFLPTVMGDDCSENLIHAWDKLFKMQTAAFTLMMEELSSEGEEAGDESGSG